MKKKADTSKEIIMDMPEVKDIPGQEHIRPPHMREMMDSTPSSSDEEGEGLLDDLNSDDDTLTDDISNVSSTEKDLLRQSDRPVTDEDKDLIEMQLDDTDEDGEQLSENSNPKDMGADLDIPGSDLDDNDEELGEEDEENNAYSGKD